MGIEQFIMERTNVSGETTIKHIEITRKLRDKLNHENKLDFNLYTYAKNRNNKFH